MEEIGKLLQEKPDLKLIVTGHTDAVGGFDFNRDLSQRRAAAVVAALNSQYRFHPGFKLRQQRLGVLLTQGVTRRGAQAGVAHLSIEGKEPIDVRHNPERRHVLGVRF